MSISHSLKQQHSIELHSSCSQKIL
jgi:hypothetical protein